MCEIKDSGERKMSLDIQCSSNLNFKLIQDSMKHLSREMCVFLSSPNDTCSVRTTGRFNIGYFVTGYSNSNIQL